MRGFVVQPRPLHRARTPGLPHAHEQGIPQSFQDAALGAAAVDVNTHRQHGAYDAELAVTEQLAAEACAQLALMDGVGISVQDGMGVALNAAGAVSDEWVNGGGFPQQYPMFDVYYNNEDVPYQFHAHAPAAFPSGPIGDPLAEPIPNNHNVHARNAAPPPELPPQGLYLANTEKHRRHASQDINPTPPKRVRGHDENCAPSSPINLNTASPPKSRKPGVGASGGVDGHSGEGATGRTREPVEGAVSKGAGKAKATRSRSTKVHPAGKAAVEPSNDKRGKSGEAGKGKGKAKADGEKVQDGFESDSGSGGGGGGSGHWTKREINDLLYAILGSTSITEFAKFEKNPSRYCKRIARRVFNNSRSEEAVKARYMRMRNVFMNICTFESHTGNGGDPDLVNSAPPDWKLMSMEDLEARFEKGRKAGKEYGALTATVYRYWQNQGWYDLFMNKLSKHPNLARMCEYCPEELSDVDPIQDQDATSEELDQWDATSVEAGADAPHGSAPVVARGETGSGVPESSERLDEPTFDWSSSEEEDGDSTAVRPAPKTPKATKTASSANTPIVRHHARGRGRQPSTTPNSKRPGVPEPKHPGKPLKNLPASNDSSSVTDNFLSASGTYLKSTEATNKQHLTLAERRFDADQAQRARQVALEERQIGLQERKFEREVAAEEKRVMLEAQSKRPRERWGILEKRD